MSALRAVGKVRETEINKSPRIEAVTERADGVVVICVSGPINHGPINEKGFMSMVCLGVDVVSKNPDGSTDTYHRAFWNNGEVEAFLLGLRQGQILGGELVNLPDLKDLARKLANEGRDSTKAGEA